MGKIKYTSDNHLLIKISIVIRTTMSSVASETQKSPNSLSFSNV